ncbi:phosphate/phosphite/phosphonate ABC transporter substrate-binding protein [Jhaorihella thermophila]|uniref:ABC transporter, phosphonate, substrate-binding protein n=1 Tax=Jhaorihella thermophila TaxID=488547 RepID=A0A1H5X6Y8_9RHOB|nr:PhnD/SsuA/transferrin family substrate-binding protein [Jhaorihella thermophila]SEG07393.1 ABC transporter, phosphonate, substrate-binding protein [Jhaorihella thermophila]
MIAALGMYDMAPLRAANDRLWNGIREALGYGPSRLTRDMDFWDIWQSPDLLLAQTCGLPYRTRLHGKVQLVGTPDYGLPGCPPGYYCSVIVTRADDPRETPAELAAGTMAFNDGRSQSGWASPIAHLSAMGLRPAELLRSGGHALSARAVAEGRADFAALDAVTWTLLREHDPVSKDLREVGRTEPTPGLPLITAKARDAAAIAEAVRAAIAGLSADDRAALHLQGLVAIPAKDYLDLPTPAAPDAAA